MEKNFETLEVGRRYKNREGEVVKIVKNDDDDTFPFDGDNKRSYTPDGKYWKRAVSERDLIELLPEEPTNRLAELEAKRAELDKEIEELKKNTQTLYCEATAYDLTDTVIITYSRDPKGRDKICNRKKIPAIIKFDLPFQKVNGKWEPAFEIVPK